MFKGIKKVLTAGLVTIAAASMLLGCGKKVDGTAPAISVNNETVSTGAANMYLRYQQAMNTTIMLNYGAILDDVEFWNEVQESGDSYGEEFKAQIVEFLVDMVVIKQHAGDYDFVLSDDVKTLITSAADKFLYNNEEIVEKLGIDQAAAEEILTLFAYQRLMRSNMVADVDREVSDEEAKRSRIVYARIALTAPEGYEGTSEDFDKAARSNAEELLKASKKAGRIDDSQMKEIAAGIDESIEVYTPTINENSASIDAVVLAAALELKKDGEYCKEVVEGDGYLYVIEMYKEFDAEATETAKTGIINQRENDRYDGLVKEWRDNSTVEMLDGWKNLKIVDEERYVIFQ